MKSTNNFITNLHLIASKDDLRPALSCIYFKNGYAYVTDAHVLIKQSLEHSTIIDPEHLEGKCLHYSIYQMVKSKFTYVTATPDGLLCIDGFRNKVLFDYSNSPSPDFATNMESVFPKGKPQEVKQIGLNTNIINTLRKAMLHSVTCGCKFEFYGPNKAVLVTAIGIKDQVGLIMPVMINDENEG